MIHEFLFILKSVSLSVMLWGKLDLFKICSEDSPHMQLIYYLFYMVRQFVVQATEDKIYRRLYMNY